MVVLVLLSFFKRRRYPFSLFIISSISIPEPVLKLQSKTFPNCGNTFCSAKLCEYTIAYPRIFSRKKKYIIGESSVSLQKKKKCNKENNNECTTKANKWSRKDSSNNLKSYRWVVGFKSMGIHLGRKNKIWQSIRWIVKIREADCTPATPQIHSMIPPSLFFLILNL